MWPGPHAIQEQNMQNHRISLTSKNDQSNPKRNEIENRKNKNESKAPKLARTA